ncbi:MAG TPA: ATP-binding protein [Bacteroidales bacterium]|nr:ATP-binding protein [Bacteroidales bacterium]
MALKNLFNKSSLKITLIYFVLGFLWIFFSDMLLLKITPEASQITNYQTIKGVLFVAATSVIIYQLSRRELYKKDESIKAINQAKEEYLSLYEEYEKVNRQLKENYQQLEEKNEQLGIYYKRITESEERYRTFINQISEGVYRMDLPEPLSIDSSIGEQTNYLYNNLIISECNPSLANFYGFQTGDELTGHNLKKLMGSDKSGELYEMISQFIQNGYQIRNVETQEEIFHSQKYFNNTITGIINERKLIRVWGTQQDITSIKEKEKEIIRQKEKAEESNRIKNAFLANISHEIRTPLNSIMGFSDLLDMQGLSEEDQHSYITHIRSSGNQLLRIVSDILDISFIQTGQLKLHKETFSLNRFMEEAKTQLEKMISRQQKDIKVKEHFDLAEPLDQIIADKDRLSQVLSNITENAAKFTQLGTIEMGYRLNDPQWLAFYVRDTGIGIPREKFSLIFEHFRQVEEEMTRHYGGIGLGLSIVKGIVEAMGGEVHLDSQPDEGSEFIFTIPYHPPEGTGEKQKKKAAQLHRKKVLIVEDHMDNYKLLEEFLIHANVSILHAISGEKGLELCRAHNDIDLVLMDLKLPGIDGVQTTRKLKEICPDIPVIAQTAYIRQQYMRENNLFIDYLTKPITKENFRTATQKHLDINI